MERIYLDHAATTPVRPEVAEAMRPFEEEVFGNPSSLHARGRAAREKLDEARDRLAAVLGCRPGELVFTSGGSESDTLAIVGVVEAAIHRGDRRRKLLVSAVEHRAVLDTARFLARRGVPVEYLPVNRFGQVDPDFVLERATPDTLLVSVMYANNEVGTIQPVQQIGRRLRERGILFHIDAVQAPGYLPLSVDELHCDLLTLSAHKFYGPKGAGLLYVRRGVEIAPLIHGGAQERGRRAGTENVAGVVGMAVALELAERERPKEALRQQSLRERLLAYIRRELPDTRLHGHPTERLANNLNLSWPGVAADILLFSLDLAGIDASSGAACSAGALSESHVLVSMGIREREAGGPLRLTLGRGNTESEIDEAGRRIVAVVRELRERLARSRG
ncbi:MAG: cysteine desulfurase [Limnochordales bacterium]|nr:cysteine desulfurase [Limnochordales bacterium]